MLLINSYFYRMMRTLILFIAFFVFIISSCTKEKFITGKNVFLITSDTAIHFDTVFTSIGSVTKQLKIFNINDQKLRINNLQLMGGANSFFKINVSGSAGVQFSNVDMEKGDSLYVFITANINPTTQQLPFIIEDSIRIDYNGNVQYIKLDAFGQNAHFLRSTILTQNTTWQADMPYVLLDTFAVSAGAILTIEKGAQIYCHANTPFTVEGSLQVNGNTDSAGKVTFQNDRLDAPYKDQPGTWAGIYFSTNSIHNELNGVVIKNALQGIAADNGSSVLLNECKIDNCAGDGILTDHATVKATNCLISNCSYNVYCSAGGNYTFTNCTLASYTSRYLYHQYQVLTLRNFNEDETESNPLQALFQNCIIYGEEGIVPDEVAAFNNSNVSFSVDFENTLYRSPAENPSITYTDCLMNVDPQFQTIDRENNMFDFNLSATSPCIDAGKNVQTAIDLAGNNRTNIPDMGCYEFH